MRKSRLNLAIPLVITFILMVLLIIYTSRLFYRISVSNIYEVGEDKISGISASLGNYLDTTKSVLWVTADTVDFMVSEGETNDTIHDYLVEETQKHKSQFDENYTGLYGYIRGEYLDGLNWEPPADYDPILRDWYQLAKEGAGGLIIVPPYVDAQTGSVVISVSKLLSDGESVLSLDVITNHIQNVIESINIKGKGYGFILDKDGMIIAHSNTAFNGMDYHEVYGSEEFTEKLRSAHNNWFETTVDGKDSTVFVNTIMDQWNVAIVVANEELFTDVHAQLMVNIAICVIVYILIAFFYFIAYRNEEKISREAEALKISEQQKVYEAELLRLEKSSADAANKAKGDFLAQMSHEIRTPINAVLGMNEMILRESENEDILEYSRNIQSAGRTLLALINSILDFSKIEDGKMEIVPVKYDTRTLICNLVNSVSERVRDKGLELVVEADPGLPRSLMGDDVRLTEVIMNLLTNAVKYTEKGRITFRISMVECTQSQASVAVAVKDTGIGIRSEDMNRLFESFTRLEEIRNRNIEGTGLGMAIVTKLLALMDSELKVESTYGVGSEFSFVIRQGIADPKPIGDAPVEREALSRPEKKERVQFPGACVLVTDDNDMNRKVARNLLKLFGISAELAASGPETLEKIKKKHYDLIFLDHMMPKMDGLETLEKIKEEKLLSKDTAVIALTANAVIGAKEFYIGSGFRDYLSKPIEMDRMEEILCRYLGAGTTRPGEMLDCVEDAEAAGRESEQAGEILEFAPKASDEPCETKAAILPQLEKLGLVIDAGLAYCGNDEAFYVEMLEDYVNTSDKRWRELEAALTQNDMDGYCILIHALKSTSKTVGINDVFELAKELEERSKNGEADAVREKHRQLEAVYRNRVEALKSILG